MRTALLIAALATPLLAAPADLILFNGKVWTVDPAQPAAQGVAITANRIERVGSDAAVLALKGPATKVIDLQGRLVLPGFNDAHTHFENAVDWVFHVRLVDVRDQADLLARLRAAAGRVPKGLWLTGGDLESFAWLAAQRQGDRAWQGFWPDLAEVDRATPDHPVLLRRFDRTYFANSLALRTLGLTDHTPDPPGGKFDRDPVTGRFNGRLLGTAGEIIEKQLPPATFARKLVGARVVQADLNRHGITSIQDMARHEAISQGLLVHSNIERSHTNLAIFQALREAGELTLRVHGIMALPVWNQLARHGIRPGAGDEFINFGTLKDFVDGSLMFEPLHGEADYAGRHTFRFVDEPTTRSAINGADDAGFDIGSHVIGDRGMNLLLDRYEEAFARNGPRDRRFRLIHAELFIPGDFARAGRLGMIADVTPRHLLGKNVAAFEKSLGPERSKNAFAWRTMLRHGVRLNLVSDLPGSFNLSDISPFDPLRNIYSAVTRRDPERGPPEGWHTEQALTVEEAIHAYTANPAYTSREEHRKGTITAGKLADLVVLSRDILTIPPEEILKTKVVVTIFNGRVVYQAQDDPVGQSP